MDQLLKVQAIVKACNISDIAVYSLMTKCQQWLTASGTCEVLKAGGFLYVARNQEMYKQVSRPEMI